MTQLYHLSSTLPLKYLPLAIRQDQKEKDFIDCALPRFFPGFFPFFLQIANQGYYQSMS